MRTITLSLFFLGLFLQGAWANGEVQEYIEKAIEALRATSYEARMNFLSPFDPGLEQQVLIFHVAPELYRVIPLEGGEEGNLVYIENAVELVRVRGGFVETMPIRQFYNNDSMTIQFLRDLGRHEGTTLLAGLVGDQEVHILRQNTSQEKPYTITVGLDKANFFPLFLLVVDSEGKRRVYFEMEVVEYCKPGELKDDYFIPQGEFAKLPPPRQKTSSALWAVGQLELEEELSGRGHNLPLVPLSSSLPLGYTLESISRLDFPTKSGGEPALVFHLEIFGPRGDVLSIFETQSDNFSLDAPQTSLAGEACYVLSSIDGWMVAAFGSLSAGDLLLIIEGLRIDNFKAAQLLDETLARQQFMDSLE